MRAVRLVASLLLVPAACRGPRPAPPTEPAAVTVAPQFLAAVRLSLDTLIAGLPADTAAACIELVTPPPVRWISADSALLASLTPRRRPVVPRRACPRSYAPGPIMYTDTLGRPLPRPARPPAMWTQYVLQAQVPTQHGDTVRLEISVVQGTGGPYYRCEVTGARPRAASCQRRGYQVH